MYKKKRKTELYHTRLHIEFPYLYKGWSAIVVHSEDYVGSHNEILIELFIKCILIIANDFFFDDRLKVISRFERGFAAVVSDFSGSFL